MELVVLDSVLYRGQRVARKKYVCVDSRNSHHRLCTFLFSWSDRSGEDGEIERRKQDRVCSSEEQNQVQGVSDVQTSSASLRFKSLAFVKEGATTMM